MKLQRFLAGCALASCLVGFAACQNSISLDDYLDLTSLGCNDSEYLILIDKSRNQLYLGQYKESSNSVRIRKRYGCSTGRREGDKQYEGDCRTPVGNYQITDIMEYIPQEYGPKAFALDYPNADDKSHGRTGSGIWIHGSNRYQGPTKGCVRLYNGDLIELGSYVQEGTKVIIREEI